MTNQRYSRGRALGSPRVLVIHATAGRAPGDLSWLRQGGTASAPVSCHYYIDKAGRVSQLVQDRDTAWHCGAAAWTVDGTPITGSHQGIGRLNWLSLGIELENLNTGHDPYPDAQIRAAAGLARHLVTAYQIPREQLVRHLDIAPGRKSDPAGLPWGAFVDAVYGPRAVYHADSPILGPAHGTPLAARRWFERRSTRYAPDAISTIVSAYVREGEAVNLDWFLALAQCAHETGSLTSALSGRPTRNPAGLGVTGETSPGPRPGFVWDEDRDQWRRALSFVAWDPFAVRAHLGRLLAYALPAGSGTAAQQAMIAEALAFRPLPSAYRGAATTIGGLDGKWAVPGDGYGARVALLAERMREAA